MMKQFQGIHVPLTYASVHIKVIKIIINYSFKDHTKLLNGIAIMKQFQGIPLTYVSVHK